MIVFKRITVFIIPDWDVKLCRNQGQNYKKITTETAVILNSVTHV